MAVINLETGAIDDPVTIPTEGRIIDLDTGNFINPVVAPRTVLGPAATRQQESVQTPEPTRAVKELPEIGFGGLLSGEDAGTVGKVAAALAVTTDPQEMGQILTNLVPSIGITEDEGGNLIANNNKNGAQVIINRPGMSGLDFVQGISTAAAFTPGAMAANIAKIAGKKALTGAITAGVTQTAIEAGQEAAGGEFNEDEIAIAAGLGGTAELILPAIQSLRQSKLQSQAAAAGQQIEDVAKQVDVAEQAARETGIPLFPAQKTVIPSELEKQSFIAQLPTGTAKASKELAKQNKSVAKAVDDLLESIAPPESVVTGPGRIRTAAQNSIANKIRIRREAASPLYRQAFEEGAEVDLKPVIETIDTILDEFPKGGEVFKSFGRIKRLLGDKPTLKKLHNAKLEIDQMINKVGSDSLGNTTKSELTQVKNLLLDQMDEASPSYKQARDIFAENSPAVNELQDSIIGKLADIDDTQLKDISKRLFNPAETNPQVIKKAKKIIEDVDPDAWNQILRTEFERRLGSVRSTLEEGSIENIPGQMFKALFGNSKQRAVLFNSVDGDTLKSLKFLETALGRGRLGRPGGSQTAGREEIKRELRGGVVQAFRNFFGKPISGFANLGTTILTGTTADAAFDAKVRSMANALFDPQWKPRIKELRRLKTDSPAAVRAMTQLLDDALVADFRNLERESTEQQAGQQ